jgi:hypothetical protein
LPRCLYENFELEETMKTGIIPVPKGGEIGGKDNDEPRCKALNFVTSVLIKHSAGNFEIRNSWGPGIGLNGTGYFQCSYEVLEKLLMDMWVIIK